MPKRLLTEGAAYAHYFADCPCCGRQLSLTCRIQGNLAQVKAEHWGIYEVLAAARKRAAEDNTNE